MPGMFSRRLSDSLVFAILVFTLCVIGFWVYRFLFWLLTVIWHLF